MNWYPNRPGQEATVGLDGPSKTIIVQPQEMPTEAPPEVAPTEQPAEAPREPVPA